MLKQSVATLVFIIFATPLIIFGQSTLSGKVIDKNTNIPIPFATVGLIKQNSGTTADQNGNFLIKSFVNTGDTLRFSSVGYYTLTIPLSKFIADSSTPLLPKNSTLPELIISSKSNTSVVLNNYNNCSLNYYAGDQVVVTQLAQYYQAPKANMIIREVSLCKAKGNSLFRIHIYDIDTISGKPSAELTTTSIEINSSARNVKIDLEKYNIVLPKKSFFIAVEWLLLPTNQSTQKIKLNDRKIHIKSYYPWIGYRQRKNNEDEVDAIKHLWFLNFNGNWSEIFPMYRNLNFLMSVKLQ